MMAIRYTPSCKGAKKCVNNENADGGKTCITNFFKLQKGAAPMLEVYASDPEFWYTTYHWGEPLVIGPENVDSPDYEFTLLNNPCNYTEQQCISQEEVNERTTSCCWIWDKVSISSCKHAAAYAHITCSSLPFCTSGVALKLWADIS